MKKNFVIEMHELVPYAINAANNGLFGEVKNASIGGVSRAVMSSQSLKYAMRTKMAEDNMRTNYYINEIIEICSQKDNSLANNPDFLLYVLKACDVAPKDALKQKKNEPDADFAARLMESVMNGEGIKSGTTEVTSHAELEDIATVLVDSFAANDDTSTVKKKLNEMNRIVDLWTAAFGRMSTNSLFSTIDSAVSTSMSYSVDAFLHQTDYFTVIDSLQQKYAPDNAGAANMQDTSISANLMYRYMNISVETLARNWHLFDKITNSNLKEDAAVKEFVDFIVNLGMHFMYSHPIAKQHAKASMPTPTTVAIFAGKNIFPCTMDSAFTKVVQSTYNKSTAEVAAERVVAWTEDDMIVDQYDSAVLWTPKTVNDSASIETRHGINSARTYMNNELANNIIQYIEEIYQNK